jgi:hypothetical protein
MPTKTEVEDKKHEVQLELLEKINAWIEEADTGAAVSAVAELSLAYRYLAGGSQPGGAVAS